MSNKTLAKAKLITSPFRLIPLLILLAATDIMASTFITETLDVENRNPINHTYGLSRPTFHKQASEDQTIWRSRVDIANYLSKTGKGNDYMFVDGESWTFENTVQFDIGNNINMNISLPWIYHGEGIFDRLIYEFHEITSLPQNGRTDDHHDRILWQLANEDGGVLFFDNSQSGIGDMRFSLSWPTTHSEQNIQWRAHIELPTGSFDDQTGNGGLDAGMSALWMNPSWLKERTWLSDYAFSAWYGAGVTYVSHHKQLDGYDPIDFVFTFRSGFAWQVLKGWNLKAQFDTQSPLFETDLRSLGWIPAQVSFATQHAISEKLEVDFIIIEDLRPRVTPDVIFSSGMRYVF